MRYAYPDYYDNFHFEIVEGCTPMYVTCKSFALLSRLSFTMFTHTYQLYRWIYLSNVTVPVIAMQHTFNILYRIKAVLY
jgi:hypothetical protein